MLLPRLPHARQVAGWLRARIERPGPDAAAQLTREHGWTRLVVAALIVDRDHWRSGAGTALLVLQPHLETIDSALVMEPPGAGLVAAAPA